MRVKRGDGPTARSPEETRVLRVVASTLGCSGDRLAPDARINETEGWDSLMHVQLMLALEREFGVRLDAEEILRLTSLERILGRFRGAPPGEVPASPAPPASAMSLDEFLRAFARALPPLGIASGDVLLVHSFLGGLLAVHGKSAAVCERVVNALREALGPGGTLVMPTFARTFTRKGTFDRERTPSEMGVLTEIFRNLPGVRHSPHPYHRFSALGPLAGELARSDCRSSFGPGSPLHLMHRRGGKVLFFSVDWDVCTFFHYVEEQFEVPYRTYKEISGTVTGATGSRVETWLEHAGSLGRGCEDSFKAFGRRVEAAGLARAVRVGPVHLKAFRMDDVFDFTFEALERDVECLVTP